MSEIVKQAPGSHVELLDIYTGKRKLAIVDETGLGYFDLIGDDELPKPLHAELKPEALGAIASWLAEMADPERAKLLGQAWLQLSESGADALTVARAVRWGVLNDNVDADTLLQAGQMQTDIIRSGRQRLAERLKG
ncbi:hypothetical protein [Cupriavidus pampae]|jgi:hypothetical protein|uniref:Uncharacterized protein n=1 Tax=Cupriavidus pampae TaxID=659251 RepID=A0ABN7ZFG5_9BURK|nr:hypothetical protein [Cupriavidus pampae]CAG9184143.1 hypothetical protein LMG32289_05535 [Cupriavidus pampae]